MTACGLCHQPSDRPRYLVGIGTRYFHRECEEAMSAMGYDIREERRSPERRAAALRAGTGRVEPVSAQSAPANPRMAFPVSLRGRGALRHR